MVFKCILLPLPINIQADFCCVTTHPTPLLSSPRRKIHFAHHKIPDHTVVFAQTRVVAAASQRIFTKSAKQVPNGIQPWQVGRSAAGTLWAMKMSLEVTLTHSDPGREKPLQSVSRSSCFRRWNSGQTRYASHFRQLPEAGWVCGFGLINIEFVKFHVVSGTRI